MNAVRRLFENPIYLRERKIQQRMRRPGVARWVNEYLAILILPTLIMLLISTSSPKADLREILKFGFFASLFVQVLYVCLRAITGTFAAVTGEKENSTLEPLLASPLHPRDIVAGKLLAGIFPIARDLSIFFPLFLGLGLLGQVSPALCFGAYGLSLLFALFFGLVGLYASASTPSSVKANGRATTVLAVLLLGTAVADGVLNAVGIQRVGMHDPAPMTLVANPVAGIWFLMNSEHAGSVANPWGAGALAGEVVIYGLLIAALWWWTEGRLRRLSEQ